ncbi:hypothetical protein ATANTOWER_028246, partial [Ataeniobius toweri]|nr:hypothetical protein [Ataeniobius toweri]
TSASARYFQAFLVDGVVRWNEDRAAAPADAAETSLHSCSGHLKHALNQKSQRVLGLQMVEDFTKPAAYTGELIGLEYLFRQTGSVFEDINLDPDLDPFPRLRMRGYNRMRRTPPSSHQIPPLPLWQHPSQVHQGLSHPLPLPKNVEARLLRSRTPQRRRSKVLMVSQDTSMS